MANYPSQLKERDELNLRLGIKSSLSQLRSVIASLYVIYVANDKQAQVTYSQESIDGGLTSIKLEDKLAQQIDAKFPAAVGQVSSLVNKTPLFTAQLEALQVGIELFFHLAKVNFVTSGLSERTGSSRFQKKLSFATNMILIDLYLSSHSSEDVNKLLSAWLEDKPFTSKLEDGLKMLLNTFTEETQYKIRDNNLDEIVFNQEGVYNTVLRDGEAISKDANEPVGPFRIYKSYVASGMHPYLIEQKQEFKLNGNVSHADLENYAQLVSTALDITPRKTYIEKETKDIKNTITTQQSALLANTSYLPYLTALRTKPFMLLAGISGTGKSRIVRELAFKSCPSYLQDEDGTTPGNYCMIEVKPNWHDSSELLGYYSNIAKNYQFTKFVKFLVKAMMFPKVPFFVCMDEMNLAPVEQYFAEFLSVLETRKKVNEIVQSGIIVDSKYFSEYGLTGCRNNGEVYMKLHETGLDNIETKESDSRSLIEKGLTLPDNVFIVGTVNMDDTTHQFSRKVLDRAMTIEMNGEDLTKMFDGANNLEYLPKGHEWELAQFQPKYVSADEVLQLYKDNNGNLTEDGKKLKEELTERLSAINKVLKDTPFLVSYRVLNELVIYAGVLLDDGKETEEAINDAVDQITLMKILPRIEGDEDMLGNAKDENNRLCQLMKVVGPQSQAKLREMNRRLESGFTRFWP